MAALTDLFWRPLSEVRSQERPRFLFFAGLSTLISLAQTVGFVGTEALFLARFGADRLPETFIAAAVATVLGSFVYAARVGAARNDGLFIRMLVGAGLVLCGGTAAAHAGLGWALPALLAFYYLTQAVFVNHTWTFTADYFDAVASKRLIPLLTLGASAGGVIGGVIAALGTRTVGPVGLIAIWAVFLLSAAVLIRAGRSRLRRWGPLELEEADETSVRGIQSAVRYLSESPLGRWLALSALGMVFALFIAQFLYSDIFAREFPTSEELAAFFGVYLAVTNGIEIAIEALATPWLIRRLGVPTAHLVHPVLTLLSFGGMAFHYQLVSGVASRMNREMLENALAGPVRSLVYNAMPMRFRGRTRAFLEGIVVYGGMAAAGALLLALERPDPFWLCVAGAVASLLYLLASAGARRAYLRELVTGLRAGRLDLADVGDQLGDWEATRLADLAEQLLRDEGDRPSASLLQLIPALAERGVGGPLLRATAHPNPAVRRACVAALTAADAPEAESCLERALADPDPGVRIAAVRGVARLPGAEALRPRLRGLTDDPQPEVRAEAAALSGDAGLEVLEAMLAAADSTETTAALRVAPAELIEPALARARDPDPGIRAAALEYVARAAPESPLSKEELARALRDEDARVRRAAVFVLANRDDSEAHAALADALGDTDLEVQFAAETVLGTLGDAGVRAVEPMLRSDCERAAHAALRVLAAVGSPRARARLLEEQRHHARQLWRAAIAIQHVPMDTGIASHFLQLAYQDGIRHSRRLAFWVLQLLEDPAVISRVERTLRFGTTRARGDALEVLSNLGDRDSAQLLVRFHEAGSIEERARGVARLVQAPADLGSLLDEARRSELRWVRIGADALAVRSAEVLPNEALMERLLALKQVPLFSYLSLEQLEALQQIAEESAYLAGDVIVREGDPGGELFVLLEGSVRVFKGYETPKQTLLSTITAVSFFGEMAVLDDEPRSATVAAAERSRLLVLDGTNLKELILHMPEIAFEMCRVLTSRVRIAESRLSDS